MLICAINAIMNAIVVAMFRSAHRDIFILSYTSL